MIGSRLRLSWLSGFLALALFCTPLALTTTRAHDDVAPATPPVDAACGQGDPTTWSAQMNAYANAGTYPAVQTDANGIPSSVTVTIPPIDFTGDGTSATLPIGPCQTIYRFAYSTIVTTSGEPGPFLYVEVDWNTEGLSRGPNGSFISPHFDFHYYMLPREVVESELTCVSTNGRTCDPFATDYTQTQLFQELPDATFVPPSYRPDIDSAIPTMGLHLLDMNIVYSVENVNHYPTLIYGTFAGKVMFAESSVTLYTLQDAIAAPDHRITFPYLQPTSFVSPIAWPTSFFIEYVPETGEFIAGFDSFTIGTDAPVATPAS